MTLREVTRNVIARVENGSSCPVVVNEDAFLKTLAASRIARGTNRIQTTSYEPSAVSKPTYLMLSVRLYPAAFQRCRRGRLRWVILLRLNKIRSEAQSGRGMNNTR